MNKKVFLIFIMFFTFVLGVNFVSAAEKAIATVKITGMNVFGRTLVAEANCTKPENNDCSFSYQWYSNTTNSTTGGTAIADSNSKYYVIDKSLEGKYIYVVVTATSYSNDYEATTVMDITDATTNTYAKVDDYVTIDSTTKYSIDVKATFEVGAKLTMTLNGIEEKNDKVDYYVKFVNENDPMPTIEQTNIGCTFSDLDNDEIDKFKWVSDIDDTIVISDDWYLLNGYEYAYIVKQTRNTDENIGGIFCEIIKSPIKVDKPSIPDLGKRYQFYLFTDADFKGLSTFPLFPTFGSTGDHMLKTKIGIINDETLLKKLANNSKDSLQSLLEYAKKHDGTTFSYHDEHYYKNDIGSFKVTDGAYYYVYTAYEDKNGMYRNLEDVTVVMGELGMLVNDVKWTTSNPDTGVFNQYGIFGLIIVIGIISFTLIRKLSKFPKKA